MTPLVIISWALGIFIAGLGLALLVDMALRAWGRVQHRNDPEFFQQQHDNVLVDLFLWCFGLWHGAGHWLRWKRRCAQCRRRIGGNPLARQVPDGLCDSCLKHALEEARAQTDSLLRTHFPRAVAPFKAPSATVKADALHRSGFFQPQHEERKQP
jgi:hypothetical protein